MSKKISITRTIFYHFLFLTLIISVIISSSWLLFQKSVFDKNLKKVEDVKIKQYKFLIKNEIDFIINSLNKDYKYKIDLHKETIKERVHNVIEIVQSYNRIKGEDENLFQLLDSVYRYNQNSDYIFIFNTEGEQIYYQPSRAGEFNIDDSVERFKELLSIGTNLISLNGEGFHSYKWKNPKTGVEEDKISFFGYDEERKWIIGCGSYLKHIKEASIAQLIEKCESFDNEVYPSSYLFIIDYKGKIYSNKKFENLTKGIQLNVKDYNGKPIVKDMIQLARERNEGSFLTYSWKKDPNSDIDVKISYVKGSTYLDLLVGTGVYKSDLETVVESTKNTLLKDILVLVLVIFSVFLVSVSLFYLIIKKLSKTIKDNFEKFITDLDTSISNHTLLQNEYHFEEFQNMFKKVNGVLEISIENTIKVTSNEERYRNLVDKSPVAIQIYSSEGTLISTNKAFEDIWQVEDHNLINHYNILSDIHASAIRLDSDFMMIRDGEVVKRGPVQFSPSSERFTSRVRWVNYSGYRVETGSEVVVVLLMEDVTEMIESQNRLVESEERFRSFMENANDMMFITDSNFNLKYVNTSFCNFTGFSQNEVLGVSLNTLLKTPFEITDFNTLDDSVVSLETEFLSLTGSEISIDLKVNPIIAEGGIFKGIRGVARDITQKRKIESDIIRNKNLESLGNLASNIAHELNNQLSIVYGYLSMITVRDNLDPKIKRYVNLSIKSLDNSQTFTNQLLTFSSGGTPVLVEADIVKFYKDIIDDISKERELDYKIISSIDPTMISFDKDQIYQVVDSLIANSKEAKEDSAPLEIEILERRYIDERLYICLRVKDFSGGIPKERLKKLYDPYFTTHKDKQGLGLTIVHSIVTKHHGFINIDSDYVSSTTAEVYLPKDA